MRRDEAFFGAVGRGVTRRGGAILGVCNVTPDSFSDGGAYLAPDDARARIDALLEDGADLVDVGPESTRPGAAAVPDDVQIARALPAVAYAAKAGAVVTIDTTSPAVARACLDAGAVAVNDASCARDPGLAGVAAAMGAPYVLMHTRGTPEGMAGRVSYEGDLVDAVIAEWSAAAARVEAAGVPRASILFDAGLGFAKTGEGSLELLARTGEIAAKVAPARVVVGASRKSFLARFDVVATAASAPRDRVGASIAAAVFAVEHGAHVVRVHDVRATAQALAAATYLSPRGGPRG